MGYIDIKTKKKVQKSRDYRNYAIKTRDMTNGLEIDIHELVNPVNPNKKKEVRL